MKRITMLSAMLIFISLVFANEAFSQRGYWGRGRGGRGRGMGYNRMSRFQSYNTPNIQRPYLQRLGRGYGRGGRGLGMGYGRMYNFQNFNAADTSAAFVPPGSVGYGRYWGQGSPYGRIYNPQTEETIKGTVISIDRIASNQRMYCGIHLVLKTDEEAIPVHLGPEWYIEEALANQYIIIEIDDKIEIVGSRISYGEKPAIVAAEIKKGNKTLTLRDEIGVPFWSGWGGRW